MIRSGDLGGEVVMNDLLNDAGIKAELAELRVELEAMREQITSGQHHTIGPTHAEAHADSEVPVADGNQVGRTRQLINAPATPLENLERLLARSTRDT